MPLYKQIGNMIILLIIGIVSAYLISLITNNNKTIVDIDNTNIPSTTTWATIDIQTWSTNTWVVIELPTDPRTYLDYIIQYGSWWVDYISIAPTNQPSMSSKVGSDNTASMHDYLYKNRIKFDIPSLDKQWYIMFVTSKPVSNISNIFLWVDWSTIWRLNKRASLPTENQNEFLYKLDEMPLIWNNDYRFSPDFSWKKTIYINAVVWEANNKVERIILFFR